MSLQIKAFYYFVISYLLKHTSQSQLREMRSLASSPASKSNSVKNINKVLHVFTYKSVLLLRN